MSSVNHSQLEFQNVAGGGADNGLQIPSATINESVPSSELTGASPSLVVARETAGKKARGAAGKDVSGALESLLTFLEAARVLGISLRQFRRLVDGGKVAFVKVSERTPRIRPSELQRFLEASAVKYSEVQS